ncbi:hypothetical protein DFQ27_006010 [Actinomortierella ambigua]|uniref:Protein kinase domain-containing protein n=1 Tax=Actinomortierella ambigua TaxID=1343610 RepID=A0A9P6Q0D4_9FUNG|nr:hypothetical protein DFQ27_006010 [Actinomortierella ambigua]
MAPLLEQLKNFIRHGKNGKQMTARDSGTSLDSSHHKPKSRGGSRNTSPSRTLNMTANTTQSSTTFTAREASETPRKDDSKNSHNNTNFNSTSSSKYQQPHETAPSSTTAAAPTTTTEAASRIVAEEKEQKSKMPVYPGLERYRLLEKMGDGAFSNVYKAHDVKMDRVVAVKVVRKFELNSHQRANILKEVQIMRQLKHPGVVELYDFFESAEHYFLILELAQGGELFHRIVKLTYFSEELTRHVIVQVAQAIRYLHEDKGVIHRDIKPENILFEPIPIIPSPPNARPDEEDKEDEGIFKLGIGGGGIGRVKLADFGLSKVVWNEQTMTPCGTVGYTAPEIVKDERYSKSVDMWALGCVLYTLLCGFPPFYDESIQALTEKVARGQYSFLSPWWDEISASVKDLITHLLCVNPAERYTIDQFLAHPWIKEGEKPAGAPTLTAVQMVAETPNVTAVENKLLTNIQAMTPDLVVKSPYRRRAENPLSPGIGLKEVFDVSNAVHRMEEESMRRHAVNNNANNSSLHPSDALNVGGHRHGAMAFLSSLNEDEDEEEDESVEVDNSSVSSLSTEESDEEAKRALRQQQQQQQQEYQRAQEQIAAQNLSKAATAGHSIPAVLQYAQPPPPSSSSTSHQAGRATAVPSAAGPPKTNHRQQQSMSTSTSTSTMASTSTTSSQRRRRAGFELNINQATLLNRRKQHVNDHSLEQQEQRMSQEQAALAV